MRLVRGTQRHDGQHSGNQDRLFYSFNLDAHVTADHLLRGIDRFLDLSELRQHLAPFYSHSDRPSIDPELMVWMLLVGYCYGIRFERRLCEEVHLNLAYRWFCRLGLADTMPDHSSCSQDRHGRFRNRAGLRQLFETVEWPAPERRSRAMRDCLVDLESCVIVDVDATATHRTEEIEATKAMIERVEERHDLKPQRLIGDTADGTFAASDFQWDEQANEYLCPRGGPLRSQWRAFSSSRGVRVTSADTVIYRATQQACAAYPMKSRCCPNTPTRKIARSLYERSREVARPVADTAAYKQSRNDCKKAEVLFAYLKRILKLDRLRLRGRRGARDEFVLTATAQN